MDCDWDFQLKNPGLANSELTNGVARTGPTGPALRHRHGRGGHEKALCGGDQLLQRDGSRPHAHAGTGRAGEIRHPGGGRHPPRNRHHRHLRRACARATAVCATLLPSRDLIADSIEMVVQAHHFDARCSSPAATRSYPACSWPPPGWTSLPSWSPAAPCCPATWAATLCFAPVSCGNSPAGWSRGAVPWKR